uniref:Sensory neuron membrane protein 2 n=1 Tax=Glossina austeni TaxID=7395 RepID=A0A1A9ULV3_GLOAU
MYNKLLHWSLVLGIVGILLSALGAYCGWFYFPTMIHQKVEENVIITDGSEQYKRFVQLPQPLSFKVYVFNVTNSHKIQLGAIPIVKEIGPYIYKQFRTKRVQHFSRDGSKITYVQDQLYIFDEEASAPLRESDNIVVLNMHMNAFLQVFEKEITDILQGFANRINHRLNRTPGVRVLKRLMDRIRGKRKSVLEISENDPSLAILLVHLNANLKGIFNDPKSMFVSTTIKNYLFDGVRFCVNPQGLAKAICNQIKESGSKTLRELKDGSLAFSFFHHKNGSGQELFEVHTGKGDAMKVMQIQKLDDSHNLQIWLNASENNEASMCNQINGTDASMFPPFRQPGDNMYIFSTDICRSVQLFNQHTIEYKGIPGYRYSIGENFVNDIGPEHDNDCFCVDKLTNVIKRKNGCLYAGALDLTTCLGKSSIMKSILR